MLCLNHEGPSMPLVLHPERLENSWPLPRAELVEQTRLHSVYRAGQFPGQPAVVGQLPWRAPPAGRSGLALRAENLYLNQNPLLQIEATAYLLRIIHCHLSTGKVVHMEAMRVQALGNGSLMTWERSIFNLCF